MPFAVAFYLFIVLSVLSLTYEDFAFNSKTFPIFSQYKIKKKVSICFYQNKITCVKDETKDSASHLKSIILMYGCLLLQMQYGDYVAILFNIFSNIV